MSQINETALRTPGVYTTEIPTLPPSVAQVSTAVPAFIGYTKKRKDEDGNEIPAGTIKPIKIYSLPEYLQYFDDAESPGESEADIEVRITKETKDGVVSIKEVKADFAAGKKPSLHNMYYSLRLYFDNGGGPCYIVSIGKTSDEASIDDAKLTNGLKAIEAFDEPTLIVFPEGQGIATDSNYYSLINLAISQCALLQDRFTLVDVYKQEATTSTTITKFRGSNLTNNDLNYGAAYYPNLKTTYDFNYSEADVDVITTTDGGAPETVSLDKLKTPVLPAKPDLESYYAAKTALKKLSPTLPPTPAIAGIYAKVDNTRGVWKAPANVSVNGVYETTDFITDAEQGDMNVDPASGKSVNAIRYFNGKGILVWGARTLDGTSSEWRFISVRRLFITVEESAKKATFPFVFEPNDANTWVKVRAMLENYLTLLWRQGALAGAKPEHAFFVKCGLGQTMTAQDILDGKLIVEIGMAAVRPAEFIILRFMHKLQES